MQYSLVVFIVVVVTDVDFVGGSELASVIVVTAYISFSCYGICCLYSCCVVVVVVRCSSCSCCSTVVVVVVTVVTVVVIAVVVVLVVVVSCSVTALL